GRASQMIEVVFGAHSSSKANVARTPSTSTSTRRPTEFLLAGFGCDSIPAPERSQLGRAWAHSIRRSRGAATASAHSRFEGAYQVGKRQRDHNVNHHNSKGDGSDVAGSGDDRLRTVEDLRRTDRGGDRRGLEQTHERIEQWWDHERDGLRQHDQSQYLKS